jgi:hypothetical protein
MEKNPIESPTPIISKCLGPKCQSLYKCTLEDTNCIIKESGEDGKCKKYEDCAKKETTNLSHGYCKTDCMEEALAGLKPEDLKK